MNAIPLADWIIIKQAPSVSNIGSMFIPEGSQKKPRQGTIIKIGPEVKYSKEGEQVIYNEFCGRPVDVDGEEYIMFREELKEIMLTL